MRRLNREIHAFQPTPSLRRATTASEIRAMRYAISTHALLAEGDEGRDKIMAKPSIFQPTPSLRRATTPRPSAPSPLTHFNPRPPCGGRRAGGRPADKEETYFNPRPPCGGRPVISICDLLTERISTHALLAEGDSVSSSSVPPSSAFQPTPSLRRATLSSTPASSCIPSFQPTPSLRRATTKANTPASS